MLTQFQTYPIDSTMNELDICRSQSTTDVCMVTEWTLTRAMMSYTLYTQGIKNNHGISGVTVVYAMFEGAIDK